MTTMMFIFVAIAFVVNYACYFSEIYRGGIEGIPKGQYEAGQVLGLSKTQVFFKIVLPQVFKRIIPPMSNEIITLVKDTSLAQVLGVIDLLVAAKHAVNELVVLTPFLYAAIFYLLFNGLLTLLFGWMEKKLSYYKV
ncbi:MAG: ABC transporter permease subunit [Clostridia bacterium]|nr:ABC transporter permease subunit [Clostridia bacterium]